jgi:hypothetical protein
VDYVKRVKSLLEQNLVNHDSDENQNQDQWQDQDQEGHWLIVRGHQLVDRKISMTPQDIVLIISIAQAK